MHDIGENVKPVKWRTEHELAFYARRTVYYFRNLAVGKRGRVPLNAVNGPVLVHYLVVLTGLQTS
jgi:hypothetical protein